MELFEAEGKKEKHPQGSGFSQDLERYAYALAELKAREAVPMLLRYVEFPGVIECLGEIGDPRVVPALRAIVSTKGKNLRDGAVANPELEKKRLFSANVALAAFDDDNGIARLGKMLGDQSLEVQQRYDVCMCLGRRHDPRAISYLVKTIEMESRYQPSKWPESRCYLIDMAIGDLGSFKCKAAVEGLIECFDLDFKQEGLGKGEQVTPATYHNRIARSLQAITGQTIGADKQQWLKWWQEKGKQSNELK